MENYLCICWDITSRCNDCCAFCYRSTNNKELSLKENKVILNKLLTYGVKKISFVGGEPLLYNYLFDLIEYGRSIASHTVYSITTNAILLCRYDDQTKDFKINTNLLQQLLNVFDWVTFSLDAPNSDLQIEVGRNPLHYRRILYLLQYLSDNNIHNKIKINTMVNKINILYLTNLYSTLLKYNINRWKLFRFLPSRGQAKENKEKYYISETEFTQAIDELESSNFVNTINISINDYSDFNGSYITLMSDGTLVKYDGINYYKKTNMLTGNMKELLNNIDIEKHVRYRFDYIGK